MTTTPISEHARTTRSRPAAVLFYYIYCEVMKLIRIPAFSIPTLLFPTMLFAFFGLPNLGAQIGGIDAGPYIMASYGAYAMMSVALFSFGVSIAAERGLGWNKLLRTMPLNPLVYFMAKTGMALIFGVLTLLPLFAFAGIVGGVSLGLLAWSRLIGLLVVGMIPFVALGLWLGYFGGPNSAPAIANVIYLPLSFASGLLMPLEFLPPVVRAIAPYLPAYHVGQLAWTSLGAGDGASLGSHLLWLAGYTALFLVMALVAYRRDEGKTYG
ncbi:MAG TPA: ABC transporter permease [Herpetosiphonaceae bacterium]